MMMMEEPLGPPLPPPPGEAPPTVISTEPSAAPEVKLESLPEPDAPTPTPTPNTTSTMIDVGQEQEEGEGEAPQEAPYSSLSTSLPPEASAAVPSKRPFGILGVESIELPKRQRGRPLTQLEKEQRKERMGRKWVRRRVIDPFQAYLLDEVGIRESTAHAYGSLAASIIHEVCDHLIEKRVVPNVSTKSWEDSRKVLAYHEPIVRELLQNKNPRYSAVLSYLVKYAEKEDRKAASAPPEANGSYDYDDDDESIDMDDEDDMPSAATMTSPTNKERTGDEVELGAEEEEGGGKAASPTNGFLNDDVDENCRMGLHSDTESEVVAGTAAAAGEGKPSEGGDVASNTVRASASPIADDQAKKKLQRSNRVLREGAEALEVQYRQLKQARDREAAQRAEAERQLEVATRQIRYLQKRLETVEKTGAQVPREEGSNWGPAANRVDLLEHEVAELRRRNRMLHQAHLMYVSAISGQTFAEGDVDEEAIAKAAIDVEQATGADPYSARFAAGCWGQHENGGGAATAVTAAMAQVTSVSQPSSSSSSASANGQRRSALL